MISAGTFAWSSAWTAGLQTGLFVSAALLGLAGGLHCVGMCGAAGVALCGGAAKPAFRWWNVARVLSYALAGAFVMVLFGSASAAWLLAGAGLMQRLRASGVWTETRLRRLTGAVLLLSWLLMAVGSAGLAGGAAGPGAAREGDAAGLGGFFCMPAR